jgi:hypothetical protein
MADDDIKRMPIKDLRQEEGADELATSEAMEPYLEFATGRHAGYRPDAGNWK